ncbi:MULTISPECIES: hypothetical protein [Streptomyces]|uniref:hypothetical protein n=1 Tax=Streptomyces scabiei TaxID=1930 RepID=UPI000A9014C9|nr:MULTISPECIES: hypothetical protein [Streptomyces]MDW8472224.1 hypothetical protein [Streptomyces scabiei]MDX2567453.1 hypothetical protein [Streptomyces scabiei]MDX2829121.1 hypothetical protein [Streptomyces scabiei]MDX3028902.1 hypothetical protein [Streptomyces scabiei]MDX3146960.1 hypothetical protein [Streptomyces scabiei]
MRALVAGAAAVVGRPLADASPARGHRLTAAHGTADERARPVPGRKPAGLGRRDGLGRE